jgi:hypothetical protein
MTKRATKRRPDLRRIVARRSYTVLEAAQLLGVRPATVRRWVKLGVPHLADSRPVLILGFALKDWLRERRAEACRRCSDDELYCFRCREPRQTMAGSVAIILENQRTVRITGRCIDCGTRMNKKGSRANLPQIRKSFRLPTCRHDNLEGSGNPLVDRDLEVEEIGQ